MELSLSDIVIPLENILASHCEKRKVNQANVCLNFVVWNDLIHITSSKWWGM